MVISQELKQFRMIVRNKKCNCSNLHLPGAFRMIVRNFHMIIQNFHMIMRNQLDDSLLACSIIPPFVLFRMIMWNGNIWFLIFLLSFLPFPSLDSTSTTSKSTPNLGPNQLHCFFRYAFGSSSTLFVVFNLIHLFCHQFIKIIPWNDFKTS